MLNMSLVKHSVTSLTIGLTRFYKTEGFLHLYLPFLYIFHAISIRYTRLRMRKSMCIPNFNEISQSTAKIKLLPVSENGHHTGIIFPVSILIIYSHRHAILHLPVKFRSNRTIGGGVMTSYRFFKMAAIKSEMYFPVQV